MDEIGNVRRQTEVYENMHQVPSDIKSFMETGTATLDKLREDLFSYSQQHISTTEAVKTFVKVTESHIQEYQNEGFIKYLKDVDTSLNSFNIYLFPHNLEDPFPQNSTELPFIIKIMKNELFPILQEFESTIANANSEIPLCGTVDDCVKKLEHILGKIRTVAKTHEHQFKKVGKLLILKLHEIRALIEELKIMNNAKIMVETLVKGIDDDIMSLKERINNLQSPNRDEF